jgi:hypothetical protein
VSADFSQHFHANPSRRRKIADFVTVIFFFGLLGSPLTALLLGNVSEISNPENRRLAEPPALEARWESWASFPRRSENYFDDHLGFRETMIRNFARLNLAAFGVSPSDKLVVGREGWLFFGDENAIAGYRGTDPLSPGELARWRSVLEERRDWLTERGIAYLVILVPDKHEFYAEYMPASLPRATDIHPMDQLVDFLAEHSDIEILDLRPALEAEKLKRRVYHRTDTHWNDAGAHAAYRAILRRLDALLPGIENAQPARVKRGQYDAPGLGLAGLVGLEDVLREEVLSARLIRPRAEIAREHRAHYKQRTRTLQPLAHGVANPKLPRAVMFRDSFGNALIPYLSEHFRRILYVWNRDVDPEVVVVEKPDIVIQQIVGRFLPRRPRTVAELQAASAAETR